MATLATGLPATALTGWEFHPLDFIKRFHYLIVDSPSPRLSQRDPLTALSLSREEVGRLIGAAMNLKHQTALALALAYGTGLRVNQVVSLKVGDIDSQRMTLRVEQGNGQKDRYAMLFPLLLERLSVWWRADLGPFGGYFLTI